MANRMKEDEKNEKIIRGLLKLPANKRCINCNNLGPQYVCTNFWTFICTNCSGIHREFTHRVKSISMAKFTSQEVSALQEGGNERAKEIYFKEWDPQRHSFPDSSNIDRLRDFIKHVYVDRRYTGERNMDRPPRVKGDREDFNDNRREDSYRGGSRSPPPGDPYERRYSERPGSGGRYDDRNVRYGYGDRSPGYDQGDYKRSPGRFEVLDDRRRDDRFGNGNQNRRFEDRRSPDGIEKPEGRSPNNQKEIDAASPPVVRPVREILGDDAPQLRVGQLPKPNGIKAPDNSSRTQRTASSSSMGSTEGNSAELKRVNLGSLIDFNADSELHVAVAPHQSVPQQTTSPSAPGGDWASFDVVAQQTVPQVASNANSLESALAELSTPVSAPAINTSALPIPGVDNVGGQWQTMPPQQPSLFPVADSKPASSPLNTSLVRVSSNQSWGSSLAPNMQGPMIVPAGQPLQGTATSHQETKGPILSQPPPVDPKPIGRKELPEDLFTALYPSVPVSVPVWQRGPLYGMGYGIQYPAGPVHQMMPTFPQSSKSTNPFDLETTLSHVTSFPSMASLQGALPNATGPSVLLRSSSFGAPTSQWVPPQPPSFPSAVSSSPYMVQQGPANIPQQVPNNMFPMVHHQAAGGFGSEGAAFGNSGIDQHSAARYPQPSTPNSFAPAGGNPFG